MKNVGFKEWALVCEALGSGRQSLILRKGGIAEGRDGFRFLHEDFLLLPTLFHEQVSKLKLPQDTPLPRPREGFHEVRHRVVVEWTQELADWEQVKRLDELHIWSEPVIRERFVYDARQSLSLAFVRVYRLSEPFVFPDAPKYGGCRSWVNLPELPADLSAVPVIADKDHRARENELRARLGVG